MRDVKVTYTDEGVDESAIDLMPARLVTTSDSIIPMKTKKKNSVYQLVFGNIHRGYLVWAWIATLFAAAISPTMAILF